MKSSAGNGSFARRYLISSLLVALIPLAFVAIFYDTLYVRALDAVAQSQIDAKLTATENRLDTYLQERLYELQSLVDQPAIYDFLNAPQSGQGLPGEVKELFRLQLDTPFVYGVVVQHESGEAPVWYAAKSLYDGVAFDELLVTPILNAEVLGPVLPTSSRPGWLVLRESSAVNGPWIGLILRLTSLAEQINDLSVTGLQAPLLEVPHDGERAFVTPIGTVADHPAFERRKDVVGDAFLPGWRIRLKWLGDPLLSPLEEARFGLIFLALVAAAAVAWLSQLLSSRLTRQIEPLVNGAERVAKGDFDTPLEVDGDGEIRALALAQERMRLRLKRLVRSIVHVERRAVLGQFAAGVAHEIRNPLATIKTTVQALSRKEADPERKDLMEIVVHEIDRANDVVQLLLDYARPRESEIQRVDVREVMETVKALTDAIAHSAGVKITLADGPAVHVEADPAQIRQIVMNLVMNAVQALEGMGGDIRLSVRKQGLSVYMVIKDTGPGVNPEQIPYLTEPFFTTKSNGTGLGLAICNQLAQANNGELTFRSVSGQGLTVILRLPLYLSHRDEKDGL